jgi:hypothetical protein
MVGMDSKSKWMLGMEKNGYKQMFQQEGFCQMWLS